MGYLLEMGVRRSKNFIKKRNIGDSGVYATHQALAKAGVAPWMNRGSMASFARLLRNQFHFGISFSWPTPSYPKADDLLVIGCLFHRCSERHKRTQRVPLGAFSPYWHSLGA